MAHDGDTTSARGNQERRGQWDDWRTVLPLAAGFLVGPMAVLTSEEAAYANVDWACTPGPSWPLHLAPAAMILLTILAGVGAWRVWLRAEGSDSEAYGPAPRTRFFAATGMVMCAFSVLTLAAQWLAIFVMSPCLHT